MKISPRVGMVYSLNPRSVVRAGYGMFWAPWNYQFPGTTNYGNIGYSFRTTMQENQAAAVPTTLLRNPHGLTSPSGNSLGVLTGVSNSIDVIDQNKGAPRRQQLSLDYQHELTDSIALSVGFAHARGDDLGLGGTNDAVININQIRPEVAARFTPAQLTEQVPNPFFGLRQFGGFANSATIARGQLLRPFPQFQNINLRQVTEGKSRHNALILKMEKRVTDGFGGRFNYTWSNLKDNQFGESNHYQFNTTGRPQDNYNIDADTRPACSTRRIESSWRPSMSCHLAKANDGAPAARWTISLAGGPCRRLCCWRAVSRRPCDLARASRRLTSATSARSSCGPTRAAVTRIPVAAPRSVSAVPLHG